MNDSSPVSHLDEHQRYAPKNRYASRVIANILDRWLSLRSVLDLGCGTGVWLRGFARDGRSDLLGVEPEQFDAGDLEVPADWILHADLGQKLDLHRRFDLVLCLEVAEHIDAASAGMVVQNCVRHSDTVLFSAALPGQQGLHHVNEQLPEYWANLFAMHGYLALDLIRPLIWDDVQIPVWYRQNMLLFVYESAPALAALRAEAGRSASALPLNRAHPELMLWFSTDATETHRVNADLERSLQIQTSRARTVAAQLRETQTELMAARTELTSARAEVARLRAQRDLLEAQRGVLEAERDNVRLERDIILGSTSWRLMAPIRAAMRMVPDPLRRATRAAKSGLLGRARRVDSEQGGRATAGPDLADGLVTPATGLNIIFISGEPDTPGHQYRVLRSAKAATALGAQVQWFGIAQIGNQLQDIARAGVVVIWRAPWSSILAEAIETARRAGARIVYDIDDLMFLPELARVEIIDGIRSQSLHSDAVGSLFDGIRSALLAADVCTCTTTEIAMEVRALQKPAIVLPNGFDDALHWRSRSAMRKFRANGPSDVVRIGYAAGSRTHQRDFAVAVDAVARVLRERPQCRLVLFCKDQTRVIDIEEFPALELLEHQLEWRQMRPVEELPDELARFDINIAPLEMGNLFCEAKSELKFFEAALVEVCTVASATGPFQRCMRDGETGFLVTSAEEWYQRLIELVDNAPLRRRVAHAAYLDVIWAYGPQRRRELMTLLLSQLAGGEQAAHAVELDVLRTAARHRRAPELPEAETILHHDQFGDAAVTVVIPVYNYDQYVLEALESVQRQTLEPIDLVVVDDASTDDSLEVVRSWAELNAERFNRLIVLRNRTNSGLAFTRNAAIDAAETPFCFLLDADNRIRPGCCEACLQAVSSQRAAFAYPQIQCFGDSDEVIGTPPFEPIRLAGGNYIDAMALVAKWAWAAVGGYSRLRHQGWEDYDFWCSLVEHGCWGVSVPEVLADYRVHGNSMLHTTTDLLHSKHELIDQLERRHGWLAIPHPR